MDEFAELKTLVENLRAALPPMREQQYQLVGVYMLAALRLGQKDEGFMECIDRFYESPARPTTPAYKGPTIALCPQSTDGK